MAELIPPSQVKKDNLFDKYFVILDTTKTPPVLLGYFQKIIISFLEKKTLQVSDSSASLISFPPLPLFFTTSPPLHSPLYFFFQMEDYLLTSPLHLTQLCSRVSETSISLILRSLLKDKKIPPSSSSPLPQTINLKLSLLQSLLQLISSSSSLSPPSSSSSFQLLEGLKQLLCGFLADFFPETSLAPLYQHFLSESTLKLLVSHIQVRKK